MAFSPRNSTKWLRAVCDDLLYRVYHTRSRIMERTCINALTYLSPSLGRFHKLYHRSTFRKNSCHEFMGNLTEDLAFDIE